MDVEEVSGGKADLEASGEPEIKADPKVSDLAVEPSSRKTVETPESMDVSGKKPNNIHGRPIALQVN